ncbi:MAG: biotin transporter BioY, partial [Oscillospiraceae bacterium]
MIEQNKTTINLVMTGLFAAVVVVLTMISIPMPSGVPITLQTFAVALCGYLLGRKYGVASVLVYMAIGAIGLPVFSGFHGGVGALVGLTGGFIWGFLPMAFLCGLAVKKKNKVLPVISGL